ncbi:MAG TPA: aldo/keto reductase [Permianibacter sp.]|nr:aldo/keto reductase [Permianibacter sp.]
MLHGTDPLTPRPFGSTGLQVTPLGLGAQWLGDPAVPEHEVEALLDAVQAAGINLIDTARSYGLSEQRLGRWLKSRRSAFVLSTKLGYDIAGEPDWTYGCVSRGVDEALHRLQTDWLDIVHLHSCPLAVLQQGEVIRALQDAKQQGKIRCVAYSGENDALAFAIASGAFDSIQCSVNLLDQHSLYAMLPEAQARGLGVLGKRPLANTVWHYADEPARPDLQVYWRRWQRLAPAIAGEAYDRAELALRFAAFALPVHAVLVGTTRAARVADNVATLGKGPLPFALQQQIRMAYAAVGAEWPGLI